MSFFMQIVGRYTASSFPPFSVGGLFLLPASPLGGTKSYFLFDFILELVGHEATITSRTVVVLESTIELHYNWMLHKKTPSPRNYN